MDFQDEAFPVEHDPMEEARKAQQRRRSPKKRPLGTQKFEIRKGRSDSDEGELEDNDDRPIGALALPQSITQEAEDERLRKRFGVEQLPNLDKVHSLVGLTTSEGADGPDRARRGLKIFLLLVIQALAGGGYFAWSEGLLDSIIAGGAR